MTFKERYLVEGEQPSIGGGFGNYLKKIYNDLNKKPDVVNDPKYFDTPAPGSAAVQHDETIVPAPQTDYDRLLQKIADDDNLSM